MDVSACHALVSDLHVVRLPEEHFINVQSYNAIMLQPWFYELFTDLPVIVVNDWREISPVLLKESIQKLRQPNNGMNKFLMRYWKKQIQHRNWLRTTLTTFKQSFIKTVLEFAFIHSID